MPSPAARSAVLRTRKDCGVAGSRGSDTSSSTLRPAIVPVLLSWALFCQRERLTRLVIARTDYESPQKFRRDAIASSARAIHVLGITEVEAWLQTLHLRGSVAVNASIRALSHAFTDRDLAEERHRHSEGDQFETTQQWHQRSTTPRATAFSVARAA